MPGRCPCRIIRVFVEPELICAITNDAKAFLACFLSLIFFPPHLFSAFVVLSRNVSCETYFLSCVNPDINGIAGKDCLYSRDIDNIELRKLRKIRILCWKLCGDFGDSEKVLKE